MRWLVALGLLAFSGAARAETQQPPYEEQNWQTNENMRNIYLGLDQHKHTGTDGSSVLDFYTLIPFAQAYDTKAAGTAGGTFTSGSWVTRTLNASTSSITGFALTASQMTLPAGTYFCMFSAPAYAVDGHQTRLYNASDSAVLCNGETIYARALYTVENRSRGACFFTLAAQKQVTLEHRCATTSATYGLGTSTDLGEPMIFSHVEFFKLR